MKKLAAHLAIAIAIFLAAGPLPAACLNDYNNNLRVCDQYFCPYGAFTCAGCYGDAVAGYYGCILNRTMD